MRALTAWVLAVACLASCKRRFPDDGLVLGGRRVPYATLRNGWSAYGAYCRSCHGDDGDGHGPASIGMQPPPRDLRRGIVKFASVPSGQLPTDDDLARIIRGGLHGTPMRGWQLPDDDVDAIVQYLKTFSPRWRTGHAGDPISMPADPWLGRDDVARARGAQIYHSVAQCWTCHAAYETPRQIVDDVFAVQHARLAETSLRPELHFAVPQVTDWGTRVLPPDFAHDPLKAGDALSDLFRTIAAGVGGTSMPAWQGVLPDEDLWALAHYLRGLIPPA